MFLNLMEDDRERYDFQIRMTDQICSFVDPDRYRQWNARREVLRAGVPKGKKPTVTSSQQREEIKGLIRDWLQREPYDESEETHPVIG